MKALATTVALAATLSLAALSAVGPAAAATRHHNPDRSYEMPRSGPGYYEGDYEYRIDSRDRAASPYAGGVG